MKCDLRGNDALVRKAKVIGEIAYESAKVQIQNPNTYLYALGVVLIQGLIFRNMNDAVKMSSSVVGAVVGTNVVWNLISNRDLIIEA